MMEEILDGTDLTAEQEELLALLLAQEGVDASASQTITRQIEKNTFPLSFAQQRLWFLDQLAPNNAFYNMPDAFRLQGKLDVGTLVRVLNEIVRRHDILRTNFVVVDEQPVQTIASSRPIELSLVDLRHLPQDEREAEVQRLTQQEARKPFNLAIDQLVRLTLLRLEDRDSLLLLTMHHIITDGWSQGVIIHELSLLYEAFSQGKPSPLPDLPIQYADFTCWEHEQLQGVTREKLLAYWQQQLAGLAPLELPTDRPRPLTPTFQGALLAQTLPRPLVAALKALSQQEEVTLFMTLLASFQTLLARWSGQMDIAVGTPIANRSQHELEGLIGFFANTLVLRSDLSADPSFRTFLHQVRSTLLAAYAHQELPFEQLVEHLQVPRDASRSPLFQVMFTLQNTPHPVAHLPELTLRPLLLDNRTSRFDLTLFLEEDAEDLHLIAEYSTDLFDQATIERLLQHYHVLLQSILAEPECSLSQLPLLSSAETSQVLHGWNQTQTPFPESACIHHLVEQQVERTPEALALLAGRQRLNYAQLNRRANQLAHHLQRLGVRLGMRVGLFLPRSPDALVSLLAILKAGGAYVPIDPANSRERLGYLLQDGQLALLLTHEALEASLPEHSVTVLCLDRDRSGIEAEPTENLPWEGSVAEVAYVLYTSGSTGLPKGVAMSHRGLCNLIHWQLATMVPPRAARLLQYASLSFDVSFQEIFPTWSAGGSVVLVQEEVRRDPRALLDYIREQEVQKLYLPVVALQQLADAFGQHEVHLPHLREITAAGEQLRLTAQMRHFLTQVPACTLHNFYGPTETHGVSLYTLQGSPQTWPTQVPIGRAIANNQVYVLDPHGAPQPIGIAGELYLGGIGVADGYVQRPGLTAERFVPDPFSGLPGARLYRTGDQGRYRADGDLEFQGRLDQQVKVRGYRVELEEIEAVLMRQQGVRESVVLVREEVPGDQRLVGYVVLSGETTMQEVRERVREQLPPYMQVSDYVVLQALPLTLNRKVDRKRLPVPQRDRSQVQASYQEASSETEREMARLWAEVLGAARIGVQDNFFELGGHSLLITRILARVRTQFGVEIAVRDFFAAPTISQFARRIDEQLLAHLGSNDIDDMLAQLDGIDDAEAERMLEELNFTL